MEAEGVTRMAATVNLTDRRVEDLSTGPGAEIEDVGPLPEEYTPVPGY